MSLTLKELQRHAEDILPGKHSKKSSKDAPIIAGTGGKTNYRVLPNLRFAYAMPVVLLVAGIGVYSLLFSQAASTICSPGYTLSNGTNIATTLAGAPAGSVICLNQGNYPGLEWNDDYSKRQIFTKSSMTTIQAAPGVAQNQVTMSGSLGTSTNITITGVTLRGASLGDQGGSGAKHIRLLNNNFTDGLCIRAATQSGLDIVIDGNTFRDIPDNGGGCGNEGRLTVNGDNANGPGGNGITISNNIFSGQGGCTDGIQLTGGADGTKILKNEFVAIKQNTPRECAPNDVGPHADPVQFYGSANTVVDSNYFHNNSTGLMAPNGGDNETITNNVFVSDGEYTNQVVAGDWKTGLISRNTFINSHPHIGYGNSSNIEITNNVIVDGVSFQTQSTSCCKLDYNLSSDSSTRGSHGVTGTPIFTGGPNPTTYEGYALATGSTGQNIASDGKDLGITSYDLVGPINCSQTLASGANIATALNGASAGSVICLNDGTYNGITLSNYNKGGYVTVRALNGPGNVNVGELSIKNSAFLRLDGITYVGSGNASTAIDGSRDLRIINSVGTSKILMVNVTVANSNIIFDNDRFINVDPPCYTNNCAEGRLTIGASSNTINPIGVTISDSYFGSGNSDGIQVGNTIGLRIIGNEFNDISAHGTAAHTDPIQLYAGSQSAFPKDTLIQGNYMHNTDSMIMGPDGSTNTQVINNVIISKDYPYPLNIGYWKGGLIEHNTFDTGTTCAWEAHCGTPWIQNGSSGLVVRNNIMGGIKSDVGASGAGGYTASYNLFPTGVSFGTNVSNGTPSFAGGLNPTSISGYSLATGSPGISPPGSDGSNRGFNLFGVTTNTSPTPDTTPPTTTLNTTAAGTPPSSTTSTTATFTFSANETSTFQCRLDSAAYASCTSPKAYTGLTTGSHTFSVKATDTAGNAEATAKTYSWTITSPTSTCPTKAGDINGDGSVNITDIGLVLSAYGQTTTTNCADLDKSGTVNIQDLSIILSKYGT